MLCYLLSDVVGRRADVWTGDVAPTKIQDEVERVRIFPEEG